MNYEIIALLVMLMSFFGMVFLITRRVPSVVSIPSSNFSKKSSFKEIFTKKTKNVIKERRFSFQIFLQKLLTRIRIFILKIDNKIVSMNQNLKKKTKKDKENID